MLRKLKNKRKNSERKNGKNEDKKKLMYILVHENDITKESSVCECVFLSAENSLRNDFLSFAVRCGVYSALFAFSELLISVEWQC